MKRESLGSMLCTIFSQRSEALMDYIFLVIVKAFLLKLLIFDSVNAQITCTAPGFFPLQDVTCQYYYLCYSDGDGYSIQIAKCPGTTVFDPSRSACVLPTQYSCIETTTTVDPYACKRAGRFPIIDPTCKSYYLCYWQTSVLRLPYLQATLAEVARIGNAASTSLPYRAVSDTTFLGYRIKKNSLLLANFMSVHMDEEHWKDPKVFRPERFINEKGEYVEDPWVMIFGSGRRRCLGEAMAKNNLFLFVAAKISADDFSRYETNITNKNGSLSIKYNSFNICYMMYGNMERENKCK